MANRIRNVQLKINLTEEEKALFEKKMKMAKCKTMNYFLRKVVSESDIYVVDLQPFREIQDCFLGMQVVSIKLQNELILLVLSIAMTSKIYNPKLNIYQKKYGRYIPYYSIKLLTKEMKYKCNYKNSSYKIYS